MYLQLEKNSVEKERMVSYPLVSVIIPCYNAENYLQDALISVEKQSYRNIEIICINDGSKDGTLQILKSYKRKSKRRVIIINIDNRGVSIARNIGIKISEGDFIYFLDADDCISLSCIENLVFAYLAAGKECDISYGLWTRNRKKLDLDSRNRITIREEKPYEAMRHYLLRDRELVFTCYLYSREIIQSKKLCFKKI